MVLAKIYTTVITVILVTNFSDLDNSLNTA